MLFKINQRGDAKMWRHERLKQAVTYFARTLKIPRPKHLDIYLLLSANRRVYDESTTEGRCRQLRESYIDGMPHQFRIELQSSLPWSKLIKCFAHEMVHVHQYATGNLRERYNKDICKWEESWMQGEWKLCGSTPYLKRPWEIEAYKKQGELTKGFFAIEKVTGDYYYGQ